MTRLPDLERSLVEAARREERRSHASSSRGESSPRSVRALVLGLLAAIGVGGIAVAATTLIETGEPVPPRDPSGIVAPVKPGTSKLLAVRTPDPDGGPPWGLRLYRSTLTVGATTRAASCVQIGRVVGGRLGILGRDGSFGDDNRFHELPVQPDGCGSLDGRGNLFADGVTERTASGDDLLRSCETAAQRHQRTVTVPRALKASLRRKLRAGDAQAIALERRLIARQRRSATPHLPLCAPRAVRTIAYGLVGSPARRVTATDATTDAAVRPIAADNGAYLFVLRGPAERHRRIRIRTTYRDGLVCGRGASASGTPGCQPPPGYVEP